MNNEKMYLINKIFNNESIRTVWDKDSEKYYISVVDVVGVLSESTNPQTYWRVLKKRLKDEGNETVTNCNALKLKSQDARKSYEREINKSAISNNNSLDYKYLDKIKDE